MKQQELNLQEYLDALWKGFDRKRNYENVPSKMQIRGRSKLGRKPILKETKKITKLRHINNSRG